MPAEDDKTELHRPDESDPDATIDSSQVETEPSGDRAPHTDVRLASGEVSNPAAEETIAAPSYRAPAPTKGSSPHHFELGPGDEISDFEVLEVLGRGAFGVVYLARQVSLDRRVALKVTANRGSEGRTMARLEHEHIVQVFSETVDDAGESRLLCMQLVPGASLEKVIRALNQVALNKGAWAGADYLAAIDERTKLRETFDPAALRDRETLAESNDVETAAWVGARMGEAINFAHANNVLHRDIKPANVLINQYGRPLLADFNISFRSAETKPGEKPGGDSDTTFGGTLAFMAPEHLEAFDPAGPANAGDVDERSDIYSLGIVVYELLTGRSPFDDPKRKGSRTKYVGILAEWRRAAPAPIADGPPTARKVLERTIAKSLAPDKEDRFQSGEQFAAALEGCRHLAAFERSAPPAGSFARSVIRRPLGWAMLLIFLPQVVGSVFNISYNGSQIVGLLTSEQRDLFLRVVWTYNAIVYPAALLTLVYFFLPVFRMWRSLHGAQRLDAERVDEVRRATLRLPLWVLIAAAVGWLPGGVIFPAIIQWLEPPLDAHEFFHFVVSFTFSGLIAVAYSFCAMQYVVMRVLYPRLWTDATDFQAKARRELDGTEWRMWFMLGAAYVVPFVATLLLNFIVTDEGSISLRLLVVSLSLLGLVGTVLVWVATRVMTRTQVALTGGG